MEKGRSYTLKVWRQKNAESKGGFKTYHVENVSTGSSFLEMLDILNEELTKKGEDPIHFDHDCREGICGTCSLFINGRPHGPEEEITVCQLHMRTFPGWTDHYHRTLAGQSLPCHQGPGCRPEFLRQDNPGRRIYIRQYRGRTGCQCCPIPKEDADLAMDAAACIGCGACVAACKNASAMLFVAAKVSQLALLPQGKVERKRRAQKMVEQMDKEGFGSCTNTYACSAECPKGIEFTHIAKLNREFLTAKFTS
jgi:succinate dehydrogenase / fumarate reductase, iron-sulfur subunit